MQHDHGARYRPESLVNEHAASVQRPCFVFRVSLFILCFLACLSALPAQGQKKSEQGGGGPKHVFNCPAPTHSYDVILARPTNHSVTISLIAYQNMEAFLTYGASREKLNSKTDVRSLTPQEPAEFVVKGLQPNTRYFYQLHTRSPGGSFQTEAISTFITQRPMGKSFTFTVQSDSHLDQATRAAVYERTLANASADQPDFHIDIGDTFMTDKYEKYQDSKPQYYAQRYFFGRLCHSVPLFLVLGNHDGERLDRFNNTADCMSVWSNQLRKKLFPNPFPDSFYTGNSAEVKPTGRLENYYAWEWGDALFIALDPFWSTNQRGGRNRADGNWVRTLGKPQYDWLERTLASSNAKFKFVFIHHLVGGLDESARGGSEAAVYYEWGGKGKSNKDEFQEKRPGWSMPIHQLLLKHHVSVVFHGHDHFYAKQDLDGIVYLMVPQPGHTGGERLRNIEDYGYVRGTFLPSSGHVRVHVSPEQAAVEYVRSFLPGSETTQRKNGEVGHRFVLP